MTEMTPDNSGSLYLDNGERRVRRDDVLRRLLQSSTLGAIIMLLAAIAALIVANGPAFDWYEHLLDSRIGIFVQTSMAPGIFVGLTAEEWVNSVFMTLFFLVVGLEIKYELFVGELKDPHKAILPVLAACGGVIVPIAIFVAFNFGSAYAHGFGIPMATDIAFALGVLALVGKGIPASIRVFLQALAIADDIFAIVVIALFYGHSPNLFYLGAAAIVIAILIVFNRKRVNSLVAYLFFGIILWLCFFFSGIEATISGVILAFTIPARSQINQRAFGLWAVDKLKGAVATFDPAEPVLAQDSYRRSVARVTEVSYHVQPPLIRLSKALEPWSTFVVLPVFAFFNAGIRLAGSDALGIVFDPVALGVFFGLLIGKPLGITLGSFLCIRSGISPMPKGCRWKQMIGAGMLGGIGFTMAIYVANLSFAGNDAVQSAMIAKAAVLSASFLSGILGVVFLKVGVGYDRIDNTETIEVEGSETRHDIEELAEISEDMTGTDMGNEQ